MIDVDPINFNIDTKAIENTVLQIKAIVSVHLFGMCANMEPT